MSTLKWRLYVYGTVLLGLTLYIGYATWMPGTSYLGRQAPLTQAELSVRTKLKAHVTRLAADFGPRNVARADSLHATRDYLLAELGAIPRAGGPAAQLEELGAIGDGAQNIVFTVKGGTHAEIIVLGAHYDTCEASPGANDNSSGVAVALELARSLAHLPADSTVRIVFFANEEPPYFQRAGMGSRIHARSSKARGDRITGMIALETLGYYSEGHGSQHYPWPVGLLYPDVGNFVAFVGDLGSRSLVIDAISAFRESTSFPSEGAALPASFPGVDWSDHWSFREEGYPAIMITDTAVYRDPHYHRSTDLPGHLNYDALARVTLGLERVVRKLASPE